MRNTYLVKMCGHKDVLEGSLKLNPNLVQKGLHAAILNGKMHFHQFLFSLFVLQKYKTRSNLICSIIISVSFSLSGAH